MFEQACAHVDVELATAGGGWFVVSMLVQPINSSSAITETLMTSSPLPSPG